jgi:hypothetical protein
LRVMSTHIYRTSAATSAGLARTTGGGAPEPTTAIIEEFICLFTHDLRRKQKRWQDGRLKYHTFNKRVMVYDDRGNFIGDTHWRPDHDLDDGEELQLDRGSAIVQVAEKAGTQTQDLTEILDKRAREVAKRRAEAAEKQQRQQQRQNAAASNGARPQGSAGSMHFQTLQRPLSTLVPNTGRIGRAVVPQVSPHEQRRLNGNIRVAGHPRVPRSSQEDGQECEEGETPRATKRRKRSVTPPSKLGHARSLFGTTLTLSATPAPRPALTLGAPTREVLRESTNVRPPTREDATSTGKDIRECTRMHTGREDASAVKSVRKGQISSPEREECEAMTLNDGDLHTRPPLAPSPPEVQAISPQVREGGGPRHQHERTREPTRDENAKANDKLPSVSKSFSGPPSRLEQVGGGASEPDVIMTRVKAVQQSQPTAWRSPALDIDSEGTTDAQKNMPISSNSRREEARGDETSPSGGVRARQQSDSIHSTTKSRQGKGNVQNAAGRVVDGVADYGRLTAGSSSRSSGTSRDFTGSSGSAAPRIHSIEPRHDAMQRPTEGAMTGPSGTALPVANAKEQRAELRIRARKKTGLLMVSEKKRAAAGAAAPSRTLATADGRPGNEWSDAQPALASAGDEKVPESPRSCLKEHAAATARSPSQNSTTSSDEDASCTRLGVIVPGNVEQKRARISPSSLSKRNHGRVTHTRLRRDAKREEDDTPARLPRTTKQRHVRDALLDLDSPSTSTSSDSESEAPVDKPEAGAPLHRISRGGRNDMSESESDYDQAEILRSPQGRKQAKTAPAASNMSTGPHIKRLQRKSIKSKEIFGFKPPDDLCVVPMGFAAATVRAAQMSEQALISQPEKRQQPQSAADTKITEGGVDLSSRMAVDNKTTTADCGGTAHEAAEVAPPEPATEPTYETAQAPRKQLANPATRGRKAARKTDAAGRAPLVEVPFDEVQLRQPARIVRPATRTLPLTDSDQATAAPANRALPGFSKANGGAWSKHAQDLLGMERPVTRERWK